MTRSTAFLAAALLLAAAAGRGQDSQIQEAQIQETQTPPPPCSAAEFRQFDFWIGDWDVADAAGSAQGTNRIEPILGGCVLQESWTGAQGSKGHSFNIYDRQRDRWHQTWVDNSGLLLTIEGGLDADGAMVLSGVGKTPDGREQRHRITWTPLPDGRVRQHWQLSTEDGVWSDAFLGFYSRKGGGS